MTDLLTADDYEAAARELLDTATYDFVAGGAGSELALRENRDAYDGFRLIPHVLRDVSSVSADVELLGSTLRAPIFVSPIGMQRLVHVEAELATARAADAAGVGMMVGTASTVSLEDLALEADGTRWFQLYWRRDRGVTLDLVLRAAAAGYQAVALTVDTTVIGRRLRDLRNRYQRPPEIKYANFAKYEDPSIKDRAGDAPTYYVANTMDQTLTWKDLEWLRSEGGLPVIVKGVMSATDAGLAMEAGAAGVMVSNHGARQLDHVPATIDVLEGIVDAVAGRGHVVIDGGIRRATDILVALAIGADAVGIGRPVIWALAQGGTDAVTKLLDGLVSEVTTGMTLLGARDISELDRSMVRRLRTLERLGEAHGGSGGRTG